MSQHKDTKPDTNSSTEPVKSICFNLTWSINFVGNVYLKPITSTQKLQLYEKAFEQHTFKNSLLQNKPLFFPKLVTFISKILPL